MASKETATIRVDVETKEILEALRSYPRQSLNSIILALIDVVYRDEDSNEEQTEIKDFSKSMK